MNDLSQAETWRRLLGYLPVPLYGRNNEHAYVLLNGGKGNFCLDVGDDARQDPESYASRAWSADVDHYVSISGDQLKLHRWDQPGPGETLALGMVQAKTHVFQKYLESRPAPRERSVVTRAIQAFRAIRACVGPEADGEQALQAFIGLLSKAWMMQRPEIRLSDEWKDGGPAQTAATAMLNGNALDMILENLLAPEVGGAHPSIDLMIRHATGRIFQEAHYLAIAPVQQDLFFVGQAKPIGPASHSLGAFFTPTPLVRTLVEQALSDLTLDNRSTIHIFDPACGSGEFLREAVRQLSIRGYKGVVRVTGYDISEPACLMARFALDAENVTSPSTLEVNIVERDALNGTPWVNNVDVCLMNPPFISWRDMNESRRNIVSEILGDLSRKRPDLAVAFLRLTLESLNATGTVAAVLPASILDGDTAAPVRDFITQTMSVKMTARLGNQSVFTDVTVDPALVVASKRTIQTSVETSLLVWADHKPGSSDLALRALRRHPRPIGPACVESSEEFSIYTVPESALEIDWAPRPYRSAKLLAALSHMPTVGDLFSVQQGTITGLNAAFLLGSEEYAALPVSERKWFRPAVMNESIRNGRLQSSTWVFYPHSHGLPTLETEDDVARRLKTYYRSKLQPYRDALIRRARVTEENWWRLSEYRSWQVDPKPKIISTYFGVAGSFAMDAVGEHVVVQGYGWLPKRTSFDERHLCALVAILNAPMTNTMLAGISNNLGGGQWNLSKRFVQRMPIVDTTKLSDELLGALAEIGRGMISGSFIETAQLDKLAHSAFGITPMDLL
ncbi:N-6 DNA methylase [Burkholderia territorii]|uniref:N-6 DNA methylase n=1 Tax=Burkholderia territorii TaxID=1503055 RepID=UPI000AE94BA4|nr:N-6 DNA methylase [Burkholderia territorii]